LIGMLARALALAVLLAGCGGSTAAETPVSDAAPSDSTTPASDTMTVVADTAPASDGGCPCLSASVEWESNGGRVAYTDRSAVKACNDYTQTRVPMATMTSGSCSAQLERCPRDAAVGVSDINAVLANADVKAALSAAPILYGKDTRAFDGSVMQIRIDGKLIEIGEPCAGATGCTPVPMGVVALQTVLGNVDRTQEDGACAALK